MRRLVGKIFWAHPQRTVLASFLVQLVLMASVAWYSPRFAYGSQEVDRPIPTTLVLLSIAFVFQMVCLVAALHLRDTKSLRIRILLGAILLRGTLLISEPIQEVDLYRYIWDGAVVAQGIDPYRWSPQQIADADALGTITSDDALLFDTTTEAKVDRSNPDQARLTELLAQNRGLAQVLERVHFSELTTVYPPVSQVVFAMAHLATPSNASLATHVMVMKLFILAFDLGVLVMLMYLLGLAGHHVGWSIVYAGSPLVLKEFANSGHLDSIAVFFTMASVVTLVAGVKRKNVQAIKQNIAPESHPAEVSGRAMLGSAVLLALGVGAKLFPVVLVPCFVRWISLLRGQRHGTLRGQRRGTSGWWSATVWATVFLLVTSVSLWPMLGRNRPDESNASGLKTFVSSWEMNDLIFMVVEENLRPENSVSDQPSLWFAIVPDVWRQVLCQSVANVFSTQEDRVPFLVTRVLTMCLYVVLVLIWIRKMGRDVGGFLETCFLSLAWFWMLAPTQNPWYWIWALPLVVFTSNRAWFLTSALVLVYYLRFWFEYHPPTWRLGREVYFGTAIFDFWIVWAEFIPLLALLIWGSFTRRPSWLFTRSDPSRKGIRDAAIQAFDEDLGNGIR